MKHFNSLVLGLIVFLFTLPAPISAQSFQQDQQYNYFGFDSLSWKRISKRYARIQPRIDVLLNDGRTFSGQIIYTGEKEITVFPGYELVMQKSLCDSFNIINFDEIRQIEIENNTKNKVGMIAGMAIGGGAAFFPAFALAWGTGSAFLPLLVFGGGVAGGGAIGNGIQGKGQKGVLYKDDLLDESTKGMIKLRKWAMFQDSIIYPGDFREVMESSSSLQRIFPNKKLRISANRSLAWKGYNPYPNLEEVLESATLIDPYIYGKGRSFSFGAAYKMNDHFYLGGEWFRSDINGYPYHVLSDSISYSNNMWFIQGFKLYTDYTPLAVDRFFSNKFEILLGAGIIIANTEIEKRWYVEHTDGNYSNGSVYKKYSVNGILTKLSANIYAAPWISLSVGIEGNFLKDITIPEAYTLTSDWGYPSGIDYYIPEHKISFENRFRIYIGTHLYF